MVYGLREFDHNVGALSLSTMIRIEQGHRLRVILAKRTVK